MNVFYHAGPLLGTYYLVFQRKKITSELVDRLVSLGLVPVEHEVSSMSVRLYFEGVDFGWLELISDSLRK